MLIPRNSHTINQLETQCQAVVEPTQQQIQINNYLKYIFVKFEKYNLVALLDPPNNETKTQLKVFTKK